MGRASVPLGGAHSSAGILDGSLIGSPDLGEGPVRTPSIETDRVGQILQQFEDSSEPTLTEENVVSCELWFQLSLEERAQFGSCFSRMVLKCLEDAPDEE